MTDPLSLEALAATRPAHPRSIPLAEIAAWLGVPGPDPDVEVTGLTLSSQRVRQGDLYAALPGSRAHGAAYAGAAVAAGAVAVLTDPAGADLADVDVPVLVVDHPRAVLGSLAAKVHGDPATRLTLIGVTGTQGKTTTTRLLEGGLQASGSHAAVIGTVGTRIDGHDLKTALTTPEAPDLQGLFALMVERGVTTCAMEVSSHALVMGRVDGVVFDVAVFTNLGRDHLDFHPDVEDYFQAKASLFTPDRARRGLVNSDDEHGRRLLTGATVPLRSFALADESADWRAVDIEMTGLGSFFTVLGPEGQRIEASCPIPGDFNVANTLAAIAAAAEAGLDPVAVAVGIRDGGGVPGRLEQVNDPRGRRRAVIDYAHKPDAVEAVLATLRPLTDGRLIIVMGAGGDRDTGKRPLMGEIAARLADVVIVTDDNPRSEDPAAIRAAVISGATGPAEVREIGDRRLAIQQALRLAGPADIVVVAGKGHETGQEIQGVVHPFDDRAVVLEELAKL